MKFIHMADMHFDCPFSNLANKENGGELRRLEQRKVFKKVIDYCKENHIEYFFISGDLYEQTYIKRETIEFINSCFQEIEDTKIFIAPGNHDPFLKNSYYQQYKWNKNVTIFGPNIQKIELPEVNIYGYGFDDFYCSDCGIQELEIDNKEKLTILVIHATLDGSGLEEKQYNSISSNVLKSKEFDYIALGHIHKTNYQENENMVYPGSPISLGFDELGEHGVVVGEIKEKEISLSYMPLDEKQFVEIEIDVSELISKQELIEKIDHTCLNENKYIKIVLKGKRNFEINCDEIEKLIINDSVIKIRDKTKLSYELEEIANPYTLRGLFAEEMLNRMSKKDILEEELQIIENAIEIGMESLQ